MDWLACLARKGVRVCCGIVPNAPVSPIDIQQYTQGEVTKHVVSMPTLMICVCKTFEICKSKFLDLLDLVIDLGLDIG